MVRIASTPLYCKAAMIGYVRQNCICDMRCGYKRMIHRTHQLRNPEEVLLPPSIYSCIAYRLLRNTMVPADLCYGESYIQAGPHLRKGAALLHVTCLLRDFPNLDLGGEFPGHCKLLAQDGI